MSKLMNKKIIKEEWLIAFPTLNAYAQNKLYKIIGPFICGIELINLPGNEQYRPHFVIYPLYRVNIKSCLDYPTLMFEFHNSTNLQLDIPFSDLNEKFKEAIDIISSYLEISLEHDVNLYDFYKLIDNVQKKDTTYQSATGKNASLLELKFHSALYVGSQSEIQSILNQIEESSKRWNMKIFESWFGSYEVWFEHLQKKTISRTDFFNLIEINRHEKKILKLTRSELIV